MRRPQLFVIWSEGSAVPGGEQANMWFDVTPGQHLNARTLNTIEFEGGRCPAKRASRVLRCVGYILAEDDDSMLQLIPPSRHMRRIYRRRSSKPIMRSPG
ncbi:hypothetical protein HGRIS_001995 [Hohenbuehelia grisea]|uniref:Uncharacterized protein n=1 Tax=Hohenbuehelia grisea TaxID=104357 RepID=A0ABR3JKW2_9AGAR